MKTVQEYLKEINKEELINYYSYNYPIKLHELNNIFNDMPVSKTKQYYHDRLSKYIDRLVNLPTKSSDDNNTYIFLVYNCMGDDNDHECTLICKEELQNISEEEWYTRRYCCMMTEQEEIMGYYIADTELTKYYLYELLAFILYEASWFGFEDERKIEEKEKLGKITEEINEDDCISAEELEKELIEDYHLLRPEENIKAKLLKKAGYEAMYKYNNYCFIEEVKKII